MKITINFKSKVNQSYEVTWFKAKSHLLKANHGMPTYLEMNVISVCDEYKKEFGNTESISEFLADCIHNDLRIMSINGKPLKRKVQRDWAAIVKPDGSWEVEYENFILNPYSDGYTFGINSGDNIMEIEIVKNNGNLKLSNRRKHLIIS
jgi:hypothetical protein